MTGTIDTAVGPVPVVPARLTRRDWLGTIKVRSAIGRMHYTVCPGLYALGRPDGESPVLATANYKLSFDSLRAALPDRNAWILVLDTFGINVWCAAGKGTFGTEELVRQVSGCNLARLVTHRTLVLPQLGAPGITAHAVRRATGFTPRYGPVEARDLPRYLDAGMKADQEMRTKRFPLRERAVLIPVELAGTLPWVLPACAALFLLGGLWGTGGYPQDAVHYGLFGTLAVLAGVLGGAVLSPLLLPWLPGRAFAVKGLLPGLALAPLVSGLFRMITGLAPGLLLQTAGALATVAIASFLSMNFTGASTYTSLSGVRKEMRIAAPVQIVSLAGGLALWFLTRFTAQALG